MQKIHISNLKIRPTGFPVLMVVGELEKFS